MPELPEVETVRRELMRRRPRGAVAAVWRSAHALRTGEQWHRRHEHLDRLLGATPGRIERRGKYLLWTFVEDHRPWTLLLHLGMTGRCEIVHPDAKLAVHTHVRLTTTDAREIRFVDARRFGGVRVDQRERLYARPPLSEMGPEPLGRDFSGAHLAERGARSRRPLRDILLDQRVVAGVGNIYAVEACFAARLHPLLPGARLASSAWERLAVCLREILSCAIANKGTTLRDYRRPGGETGEHAAALRVYGRAGEHCHSCGAQLVGFVSSGRSGAYCPREQNRPRTRWVA